MASSELMRKALVESREPFVTASDFTDALFALLLQEDGVVHAAQLVTTEAVKDMSFLVLFVDEQANGPGAGQ